MEPHGATLHVLLELVLLPHFQDSAVITAPVGAGICMLPHTPPGAHTTFLLSLVLW